MKNIRRILDVLTKGAIVVFMMLGVSSHAYGICDGILTKDRSSEKYYYYNYDNLIEASINNAVGIESKLFNDYMSKEVVAMYDDKNGYIDYKKIEQAALEAVLMEEEFKLEEFINKCSNINKSVPSSIINVYEDEKGIIYKEQHDIDKKSLNDIFKEHEKYVRENKPEESLKILNYSIENYPDVGSLYDERGCLYGGMLNDLDKAFADFEKAIKLNCISAYYNRAFYYGQNAEDEKGYQMAIDDYDMFIKLAKDDEFCKHDQMVVSAYDLKERYLRRKGKYGDIIASCSEVIELIEGGNIKFDTEENYKICLATAYMDRAYAKVEGHSCLVGKDDVIKAHELAPNHMKERYKSYMKKFKN